MAIDEPSPPLTAGNGATVCGRCGTENAAGEDRCRRCRSFLQANRVALTTANRTDRWPAGLEALQQDVAEFLRGAVVDEGDPDVPTRRKALLEYRARLHRRILQLDSVLETKGLIDRRGRLRVAWLQQLAGLIEKARGLDVTLGLARRPKQLESALDIFRSCVAPASSSGANDDDTAADGPSRD